MAYSKKEVIEHAVKNLDRILNSMGVREQGSFLGCVVEDMVTCNSTNILTDSDGSDYICPDNGEIELKSTFSPQQNGRYLRVGSLFAKEYKCKYVHFIDGVNDRQFFIPHDIVFEQMDIAPYSGGQLWWNADYSVFGSYGNNTKLLLEYERK